MAAITLQLHSGKHSDDDRLNLDLVAEHFVCSRTQALRIALKQTADEIRRKERRDNEP